MNETVVVALIGLTLLTALTMSGLLFRVESDHNDLVVYEHYLDITSEKSVYTQGEDIELEMTLFNNGDSPRTYEGSGAGHRANVWIYDSDSIEVWNNVPDAQDTDYDLITVPANSNFFLQTVTWPQVDNTGESVSPGTYEVIAMNDHVPGITGALSITIK